MALIALDCYSPTLQKALFGMRWWGRAGVPFFLSPRAPPSPLHRLLLGFLQGLPASPSLSQHLPVIPVHRQRCHPQCQLIP